MPGGAGGKFEAPSFVRAVFAVISLDDVPDVFPSFVQEILSGREENGAAEQAYRSSESDALKREKASIGLHHGQLHGVESYTKAESDGPQCDSEGAKCVFELDSFKLFRV